MKDYRLDLESDVGNWGDMGNGYYKNLILFADYSDPDVIRVGSDFYMICSEFHFMGIPVLHSKDLINWTIISRVFDRLDIDSKYNTMEKYGSGSWAPTIRYHDGLFYIYFCTPEEGLYMSTASDPCGPWSSLHEVKRVSGWEDPCPFWDDNGDAYLGRSQLGGGPIFIHRMSPDGKKLLDEGLVVYEGPTAEGTKIYKRNGYYYLVIPEGGVAFGWQTALRAKSIYGPYEKKVVLEQGDTWINGPHQGALVELENGESWFMHFSSTGALGRVCHLQPVTWVDGWPIMGYSKDDASAGEPVTTWKKPEIGTQYSICSPQTSDEFDSPCLGKQWQWNHNPQDSMWSLTERPGYLRLRTQPASDILQAKNMLTQKLMGASGIITIELCTENMCDSQKSGLVLLGGQSPDRVYVEIEKGKKFISSVMGNYQNERVEFDQNTIWLRLCINHSLQVICYYSLDGKLFKYYWNEGQLNPGVWKGARIGLFTVGGSEGAADFGWFHYGHDGPGGRR
jgi:beta-xylosidase